MSCVSENYNEVIKKSLSEIESCIKSDENPDKKKCLFIKGVSDGNIYICEKFKEVAVPKFF